MEEELLLQQPTDRRLGNEKTLPDLPPGTEPEYDTKKDDKSKSSSSKSRRKTPSPSSSSKRKARRSSSPRNRHRSPTPPSRRSRFRYSPDRRGDRYDRRRSSRDRDRDRDRDRYRSGRSRRGNSDSRSRSRSQSPHSRRGSSRWSSKNKPETPPAPTKLPTTATEPAGVPLMMQHPPPTGYAMMQPPPSQLYGDTYSAAYGNAYAMPNSYSMAPTTSYNAVYPPGNPWGGHDAYAQQPWMQQQGVTNLNSQITPQAEQPTHPANNSFPGNKTTSSTEKPSVSVETNAAHDAAVAQEAENQREELKKQRSSYIKKNTLLKKELRMLKDQRKDLGSGNAPLSPTTKGFVDENEKLQNQIQKKIATIENVIEMLTGVIGEEHVTDREETANASVISAATVTSAATATSAATVTATVVRTDDKKDNSKLTPKSINNTVLKGISQTKLDQSRTISTSSNSSRDVVSHARGHTTTSSDTSSGSSSSSTSGSSSSSEEEEEQEEQEEENKDSKKKKVATIVVKEDDDDSSPERLKHKAIESMKSKQKAQIANTQNSFEKGKLEKTASEKKEPNRFNYAFYDPEMHWCQRCNVFPKTAKDYLNHLHSIEHMKKETTPETPWHSILVEDHFPSYDNAPVKRMPIRGITFFAPATAWYCKLCCVWMGDLHCASLHLKSKLHSKKYSIYLERNPNVEMNWLADRQRVLNMKSLEAAAAPQITAVSTTAATDRDEKKSKKTEEKSNKKSKKSSEKKDKKKKKKRNKKHKKVQQESSTDNSSSDNSSSSDESESEEKKKKKIPKTISPVKELDNPNPAASIRVSMRNNNANNKIDEAEVQLLLPQPPVVTVAKTNPIDSVQSNNWNVIQEGNSKPVQEQKASNNKTDDTMIQQWNTVPPVISDNEKKLLEQLKGKLKSTGKTTEDSKDTKVTSKSDSKDKRDSKVEHSSENRRGERGSSTDRYRSKRSRSADRSRTPTRSRSRGRDWRRARSRSLRRRSSRSRGRRSRSRSRGRYSPVNRGFRRRRSRSRSRRRRSRSRSRNRRVRRSRTRSGSRGKSTTISAVTTSKTVEIPTIPQHSEFRPRVPEKEKDKEKEKEKKSTDIKDKKENKKPTKTTTNGTSNAISGKKLPFIGKMPVFKQKQASGQAESEALDPNFTDMTAQNLAAIYMSQAGAAPPPPPPPRTIAPTAAQINMAMMEDAYGNAPPFHPEAGVMHNNVDYDDLMPDPVQFVNIMAQAPPPPAQETTNEDEDVLPPGIDKIETEEFVPKPLPAEENDGSNLPKDLEEALNIIFPGERKPDDDENVQTAKESGETQIIVEEPVMQMDDLYKEGIHLVTIEETSLMAIDDASRLSMNEPLVFNKASTAVAVSTNDEKKIVKKTVKEISNAEENGQPATEESFEKDEIKQIDLLNVIVVPDKPKYMNEKIETGQNECKNEKITDDIPMPPSVDQVAADGNICSVMDLNLDDIPHPPAPLTESEKKRRQEQLDELAMLGIDADDMAAQRM